jgi:hypothetical protein
MHALLKRGVTQFAKKQRQVCLKSLELNNKKAYTRESL